MKKIITLLFITCLSLNSCRQNQNYENVGHSIHINASDSTSIIISAIQEDIVKVQYKHKLHPVENVYAPVIEAMIPFEVIQKGNILHLKTSGNTVQVDLDDFSISILNSPGEQKFKDIGSHISRVDSSSLLFALSDDESIYGAGSRAIPINRRGYQLVSYNRPQYGYGWGEENLNYCLPHLLSSRNYMLLIDDPSRAIIDIGKKQNDILEFKTAGDNLVYYVITGNSFSELIKSYTTLTGMQPLPPIWAFGHLQSRFGYRSQKEAEETLDRALEAGYPVDAIILDIYWFGPELEDGKMGQLDWDTERWPDPKSMIDRFHDKGVKVITVSEPFFTRKSKHYEFLSEQKLLALDSLGETLDIGDFYFGVGGLLDIFKPEARDWMWDQYKYMKSFGIDGWWVDLGEPEKHPDSMHHVNGMANEVHGIYGHEWARMLYDGYEEDFPEERLFHMGRSGYAGSQRFGLIPWTGDVGRNWSGFKAQTSMMLSMGLSGIPFMHSDAGGFSMGEPDEELYIRWMQYAVFTPIFRPHADASIPPEPVFWSQYVQEILKPYIDLRYQLLPYHYTMAFRAHRDGIPMALPLYLYDEEMPDTIQQQYIWGNQLLVNPVIEKGAKSLKVHLPKGQWYDFWTDKKLEEGTHIVPLTLDHTPVMVAEGAVIPMSPPISNTEEYTPENLEIHYYLGSSPSSGQVYVDDGKDPDAYETGKYTLTNIVVTPGPKIIELNLSIEGNGYEGLSASYSWDFIIHGLEYSPVSIKVDDTELQFDWDASVNILSYEVPIDDKVNIEITLQ